MNISIALAVYNEEKNIEKCLASIKDWAGEIVVVDGGSKDRTVEIAHSFTDTIILADNPLNFHINKQKALSACRNEWILQLDADEVVSKDLEEEIKVAIAPASNNKEGKAGYYLPRKNYFLGRLMKHSGLFPDYVIRLVKKNNAFFPCQSVHEQIKINGDIGYLNQPLEHYTNDSLKDYWHNSVIRYAKLEAQDLQKKNPVNSFRLFVFNIILLPLYWFYLRLLKNKGILDGIPGLIFAIGSALHYQIAYLFYLKFLTNLPERKINL